MCFAHTWNSDWENHNDLWLLLDSSLFGSLFTQDHHVGRPWSLLPLDRFSLLLGFISYILCRFNWSYYLFFLLFLFDGDVERRRLLQFEDNHEILIGAKVHARWVKKLDQICWVSDFNNLLYLLADRCSWRKILEAAVSVEALTIIRVEVTIGFSFKRLGALVCKQLQFALLTLRSYVIQRREDN